MVPNIFKYATKELSQDAVICWLVACAKEATGQLRECGEEFVRELMRCGDNSIIDATNGLTERYAGSYKVIGILEEPKTQYQSIDVYFQAKVDGKVVSFVIEDKTHSEMHGEQLERYQNVVKHDNINEDLIKLIYFKTGYVFEDEREQAEKAGYSVFDSRAILKFLDSDRWASAHQILQQYADHLRGQVDWQEDQLKNYNLDQGFVQSEFMVLLREGLRRLPGEKWPARANNVDGRAWTQYPHYDDDRIFFWRLDSKKPLRLIVSRKGAEKRGVRIRWDEWSDLFEKALTESGLKAAWFRQVRTRNGKPVWEGTIGAVDIKQCLDDEGWERSVARVVRLHEAFFRSVATDVSIAS